MHDRDQRFYVSLFIALLFFVIVVRLLIKFVGIEIEIPYVDAFLKIVFSIGAAIASAISNALGGWNPGA